MSFRKIIPSSLLSFLRLQRERKKLHSIPSLDCHWEALGTVQDLKLHEWFSSAELHEAWDSFQKETQSFSITTDAGGVNPGDRRAIYYLIHSLNPKKVLEVGTHVGSSTVAIASALQKMTAANASLTTVDCMDVNDPETKPWERFGSRFSPYELVQKIGFSESVHFDAAGSLSYFQNLNEKFDFIFLDGDHAAHQVYQEIAHALRHLNTGGYILLHDYFPRAKPLWTHTPAIYGPFLAVERFRREKVPLKIVPFGSLPWSTKKGSQNSSLALLAKE